MELLGNKFGQLMRKSDHGDTSNESRFGNHWKPSLYWRFPYYDIYNTHSFWACLPEGTQANNEDFG
jgi:hypothetical protein